MARAESEEDAPLLADMDEYKRGASTDALVSHKAAKKFPQYLAALCVTVSAFALGTSLAWTSPVSTSNSTYISDLMQNMTKIEKEEAWSWIGALMPLGAAIFSPFVGFFMTKFGRKSTMLVLVIPLTVAWGLIIKPNGVNMVYIGRLILGMAGGAVAVVAPVYTAEIAQKEIRGALGSYYQLMLTLGILYVYVFGSQLSAFYLSISCGVVPLIFALIFFFIPESPEFLISKGKLEKAKESIKFFRGKGYDVDSEFNERQASFERTRENQTSLLRCFAMKATKRALIISLGLMFIQQFSGVNPVIFYTSDIFKAAKTDLSPEISSIIVGVVQFFATFLSTLIVDRLGRKILLLFSSSVMCICTLALGVYFYLDASGHNVDPISWLPLLSLCVFMVAFSLGFGPIPWMILGELFSPNVKGAASSIACCFNWFLAFLVTKFYATISRIAGTGITFFIFMAVLAVGMLFVVYVVKETKGKTEEEIQKDLGAN